MEKLMKKMGLKQEDLDAEEVTILCKHKKIIVKNPQVTKMNIMGQESLQVIGDIEEEELETFKEDDINIILEQTGCSKEEAKDALNQKKDIASAILYLKEKQN